MTLSLMKLIDRQYMVTPFYGTRKMAVMAEEQTPQRQPETCTAANAINGSEGHLPPSADQPAGTG